MNMLTLVISGIVVNYIFFSIRLSFLIFIQWAHIAFTIRKSINVIILKEKETILSTSCLQFSSISQSCPTLCDPMRCSTPGFPVHCHSWSLLENKIYFCVAKAWWRLLQALLEPPEVDFPLYSQLEIRNGTKDYAKSFTLHNWFSSSRPWNTCSFLSTV